MNSPQHSPAIGAKTSTLPFTCAGTDIEVTFPDSGNAAKHIGNILQGSDYPLLTSVEFKPDVVIDVGANIGATALFFKDSYPDAKVFCYEPSPSNFAFLRKNTARVSGTEVSNYGLGKADSQTDLFLGNFQCLQHSLHQSIETTGDTETVRIVNAANELGPKLNGRVLLKIDTEGCEVEILESLAQELGKIDMIYLEYHSEKDRRTIDALLASTHGLWFSQTAALHRGNLAYVSNRLVQEFPDLGKWKIGD
jgi:FkbM family methyltransferase